MILILQWKLHDSIFQFRKFGLQLMSLFSQTEPGDYQRMLQCFFTNSRNQCYAAVYDDMF